MIGAREHLQATRYLFLLFAHPAQEIRSWQRFVDAVCRKVGLQSVRLVQLDHSEVGELSVAWLGLESD